MMVSLKAEYLLELNDSQNSYSVNQGVLYFEDKDAGLGIDEISSESVDFKTLEQEELSFGFTSSVYWFKIPLVDHSQKSMSQWWLDIDYTLLDDIQVYQEVNKNLSLLLHTGDEE